MFALDLDPARLLAACGVAVLAAAAATALLAVLDADLARWLWRRVPAGAEPELVPVQIILLTLLPAAAVGGALLRGRDGTAALAALAWLAALALAADLVRANRALFRAAPAGDPGRKETR